MLNLLKYIFIGKFKISLSKYLDNCGLYNLMYKNFINRNIVY